jgi:hypothetical protein
LEVDSFNYGYCVFFEEVSFLNTFIISISGFINESFRKSTIVKDFVKLNEIPNYDGNFILKDKMSSYYLISKSKDIDYLFGFQFEGNSPGLYTGEKISIQFSYYKISDIYGYEEWKYTFKNTPISEINISKYGEMGETVEGNINAELYDEFFNMIHIEMKFILTRAR